MDNLHKPSIPNKNGLARYRALLDQANDAICLLSLPKLHFVDINSSTTRLLDKSVDDLIDHPLTNFIDPESKLQLERWASQLDVDKGGNCVIESKFELVGGDHRSIELSLSHVAFSGESYAVCIGQDITDKVNTEAALRKSEEKLRVIMETIPSPIFYKDSEGIYTGCNAAFENYIGMSREAIVGSTVYDIAPDQLAKIYHQADLDLMNKNGTQTYESQVKYADGSLHDAVFFKACFSNDQLEVDGLAGVMLDITERKQAEDQLKQLQHLLKSIVDSMPSVLIGTNRMGIITFFNHQAEKEIGISEDDALGLNINDICPELQIMEEKIGEVIKREAISSITRVEHKVDGETRYVDITLFPLVGEAQQGAVIRVDNVSEQVRIEEMMTQTEKMLSVGGLAAGMAHEINNPLAGILQNIQVLDNRWNQDTPLRQKVLKKLNLSSHDIDNYVAEMDLQKMLNNIQTSGKQAANIVNNMLTFSRLSNSPFLGYDMEELIDDTVALAKRDEDLTSHYQFDEIDITQSIEKAGLKVPCDPAQIQQLLMSIIRNAAEAINLTSKNSDKATINISLQKKHRSALISISDNGCGMDKTTRQRVFEPFFTTKPVGQGTGLGMSVSYFIVTQNHKGTIWIESEVGQGTTFLFKLPLS